MYVAIADLLRSRIRDGDLKPGNQLPTERDLVAEFGVARMTVRNALDMLQLEGLIERRRGRRGGTFVRSAPPTVEMSRMEGFMPQLRDRDFAVSSQVVTAELRAAPAKVSQALHLAEQAPVFQVIRLRSVDGRPMLIEYSYFPADLVPGMLDHDLSQSLYELLESEWSLAPVRKWETIEPSAATGWEQDLLRVGRSLPLLRLSRVAQSACGKLVEYSDDVIRTDVATIQVVTDSTLEATPARSWLR